MDVRKRIALYNCFFIRGFVTALTREENKELEKSILNETIKEMEKLLINDYFFVLLIFFVGGGKNDVKNYFSRLKNVVGTSTSTSAQAKL